MFLKVDSNVTYCSEVEEMLAACNVPLNKFSNNLPLRRSQRLSQKLKKASENDEKIFQKSAPLWSGVPLDLSHKSKESVLETSQLVKQEVVTEKNMMGPVRTNDKEIVRSQKLTYESKPQQSTTTCGVSRNKLIKTEALQSLRSSKGYSSCSQQQNNKFSGKTLCSKEFSEPRRKITPKKAVAKPSSQRAVPMETTESHEDIKLPIETDLPEQYSNIMKMCKRGRKKRQISNTNSNTKPTKLSGETKGKIPNVDAEINVKNIFTTKIKQNDKKLAKRPSIHTTCNEANSNRILRNQTAMKKKNPCRQIFDSECDKIKVEKLFQNPSALPKEVCCQLIENTFNTIEAKYECQDAKFQLNEPNKTNKVQGTFNSIRKSQLKTENGQNEIQSNNSVINKNYIKSFDKKQFLAQIRNAQCSVDHLSVENINLRKINSFVIPPSPAESSEELLRKAILFNAYPEHFKDQLPPEAILSRSLDPQPLPTPDDTISSELLDSSSSSPSLPESLCELFKTADIRDILNLKQTSYHLNSYHIQALALILNIHIEYLHKVLDKVINTSPAVLKNIEKAMKMPFAPDNDLFSNSSNELWDSCNVVANSQSPKQRKISCRIKS